MTATGGRHRVAVLILPGVLPLEFGIAAQVFGTDPHYDLLVCAASQARPVTGAGSGFAITATAGLGALVGAGTVIVPGYQDIDAPTPAAVLAALRDAHARGARLVSICSGAFALAAAGLLDGRPATAHWQQADELQRRYPQVDVLPNRLYVDDGDILTSAGVTAGIDLCLHLVRSDHGAAAANTRARALVAPPQRAGGQAQYIERLRPQASGDRLAPLRDWMLANLASDLSTDALAERAHMSRRTLIRRFREETGTSPMAWLASARIDQARELLETADDPIEHIGHITGLGAPASVRAAFHRHIGTSPQQYRTLFRHRNTELPTCATARDMQVDTQVSGSATPLIHACVVSSAAGPPIVICQLVPAICPSGADRAALRLRPSQDRSRVPPQQQAARESDRGRPAAERGYA